MSAAGVNPPPGGRWTRQLIISYYNLNEDMFTEGQEGEEMEELDSLKSRTESLTLQIKQVRSRLGLLMAKRRKTR